MLKDIKVVGWFWDGNGHLHKVRTSLGWVLKHVNNVEYVESVEESV